MEPVADSLLGHGRIADLGIVFNGGELSPLLDGRIDLPPVHEGWADHAQPHPDRARPARCAAARTRYIADARFSGGVDSAAQPDDPVQPVADGKLRPGILQQRPAVLYSNGALVTLGGIPYPDRLPLPAAGLLQR